MVVIVYYVSRIGHLPKPVFVVVQNLQRGVNCHLISNDISLHNVTRVIRSSNIRAGLYLLASRTQWARTALTSHWSLSRRPDASHTSGNVMKSMWAALFIVRLFSSTLNTCDLLCVMSCCCCHNPNAGNEHFEAVRKWFWSMVFRVKERVRIESCQG